MTGLRWQKVRFRSLWVARGLPSRDHLLLSPRRRSCCARTADGSSYIQCERFWRFEVGGLAPSHFRLSPRPSYCHTRYAAAYHAAYRPRIQAPSKMSAKRVQSEAKDSGLGPLGSMSGVPASVRASVPPSPLCQGALLRAGGLVSTRKFEAVQSNRSCEDSVPDMPKKS